MSFVRRAAPRRICECGLDMPGNTQTGYYEYDRMLINSSEAVFAIGIVVIVFVVGANLHNSITSDVDS